MTAQTIVKMPFYGSEIHTAQVNGEPVVILRPTLESMGLDYSAQLKKLKGKSWASMAVTTTVAADQRIHQMVSVDLDTWAMLLANIDEKRVLPELRKTVIAYQRESAKALRKFWTQGAAVNPTITEDQAKAVKGQIDEILIARRWEQVDYRNVTRALASGGAIDRDYAYVQDTLYLGLFGSSARQIVKTRNQLTGERYLRGALVGQLRPSKVAKNYLTEQELKRLHAAVTVMTSTLELAFPDGTASVDQIKVMAMRVGQTAQLGRTQLTLAA
jgi:hypothetical protein